jgi:hypothetical protein
MHPVPSVNGELYEIGSIGGQDDNDDSDPDPTDSEGEADTGNSRKRNVVKPRAQKGFVPHDDGRDHHGKGPPQSVVDADHHAETKYAAYKTATSARPAAVAKPYGCVEISGKHSSECVGGGADAKSLTSQATAKCYMVTGTRPNIYASYRKASAPTCAYDSAPPSQSRHKHDYDYINSLTTGSNNVAVHSVKPTVIGASTSSSVIPPNYPTALGSTDQLHADLSRPFGKQHFWLEDEPESEEVLRQREAIAHQLGDWRANAGIFTLLQLHRMQPE